MKKVGSVLIAIEAFVLARGLASGELTAKLSRESGAGAILYLLGYLLPGIIGLILLNRGKKKEAEAAGGAETAKPESTAQPAKPGSTAQPAKPENIAQPVRPEAAMDLRCPRCGAKVEAGDVYCVECGAKLKP